MGIEAKEIGNEEYHSLPGISNSKLSVLIEDPREYFHQFLSGQYVKKSKDHFDFGHAVHEICLQGLHNVQVIPAEVLTKDGKRAGNAWQQYAAENSGSILMKAADYRAVMNCVEAVKRHPVAGELLSAPGYSERYFETTTLNGTIKRCKPDRVCDWNGKKIVVDLKTTTCTLARKFVRSIEDFGYARQECFYRDVLEANDVFVDAFVFIAVKDSAPHCVDCYSIKNEWRTMARKEINDAIDDLEERTATGNWESKTANFIVELAPPGNLKFKGEYSL